jgi:hypothetical protein
MNKIKEITKSGFPFLILSLITISSLSTFNVNDVYAKVEQNGIKILVEIDESYATLSNQTETGNIPFNTTILDNEINILNHSSLIDALGYIHIVGEVKNNTTKIADFVSIKGTFYDNNNNILGTSLNYTEPRVLNSSETASFDLVLQNTSIPITQIEKYTLRPVWD